MLKGGGFVGGSRCSVGYNGGMNMQSPPIPHFDFWLPAIQAGFLPLPRLIEWADSQIAALDNPPFWLIELAVAHDADGVRNAMLEVPMFESERYGLLYLGFLYLAFEAGQLPLEQLLRESGEFADCCTYNHVPACEEFYWLLNEVEGQRERNPSLPIPKSLSREIHDLFAQMVDEARASVERSPVGSRLSFAAG